ncbi:MAG: tyrosine--tRNA ligase [Candidatus Dormibacteraceae bacterium]
MATELWGWLRSRAVEIHVGDHLRERLARGDRLRVKYGMDPTAPDIHVGHLVCLDVLRRFQDDGHTAVLIVGDFTALIGDPSGRSDTRPVLSREQVDANARTYFEQAFNVLDAATTEVHGNSEWSAEMGAADVLRLMGRATLQQILQREDFGHRIESGLPVGAHEILYPLMQGYDSVAVRADVEIGGTDQLFNLLFAREIQRAHGQEPEDVMVFPLLEGLDGVQKMSKSAGNGIGIADPPVEVYGKVMSIPDRLTERYLRLISGADEDEIAAALRLRARDAKAAAARLLVRRLSGEEAARDAEEAFDSRFRRRELPEEAAELHVGGGTSVLAGVVAAGFEPSFSRARRILDQGGLRVNGTRLSEDRPLVDGDLLQAGRRRFVRIRVR